MKKFLLILSVLLSINISCSDNDNIDCVENKLAYVISVDSPSKGVVNQIINMEVKFGVGNGCGGFGKFIETENGNTRTIQVEAKYVGCVCTDNLPIRNVNYEFKTQNSGNYELKFKSSKTDYIVVNLLIE